MSKRERLKRGENEEKKIERVKEREWVRYGGKGERREKRKQQRNREKKGN